MKLLYLTSLITTPNELGEKKIEKALKNGKKRRGGEDEESMWERLGLPTPEDEENEEDELEISEDGFLHLKEDEFEYEGVDCIVRLSEFSCVIDNDKIGSVLYLKDATEIHISETAEDVYAYISILSRSRWEVFFENLKDFFRRKFGRKK